MRFFLGRGKLVAGAAQEQPEADRSSQRALGELRRRRKSPGEVTEERSRRSEEREQELRKGSREEEEPEGEREAEEGRGRQDDRRNAARNEGREMLYEFPRR